MPHLLVELAGTLVLLLCPVFCILDLPHASLPDVESGLFPKTCTTSAMQGTESNALTVDERFRDGEDDVPTDVHYFIQAQATAKSRLAESFPDAEKVFESKPVHLQQHIGKNTGGADESMTAFGSKSVAQPSSSQLGGVAAETSLHLEADRHTAIRQAAPSINTSSMQSDETPWVKPWLKALPERAAALLSSAATSTATKAKNADLTVIAIAVVCPLVLAVIMRLLINYIPSRETVGKENLLPIHKQAVFRSREQSDSSQASKSQLSCSRYSRYSYSQSCASQEESEKSVREVSAGVRHCKTTLFDERFRVGQVVQVRNVGSEWQHGVVTNLEPLSVRPNGWDVSCTWDEVAAQAVQVTENLRKTKLIHCGKPHYTSSDASSDDSPLEETKPSVRASVSAAHAASQVSSRTSQGSRNSQPSQASQSRNSQAPATRKTITVKEPSMKKINSMKRQSLFLKWSEQSQDARILAIDIDKLFCQQLTEVKVSQTLTAMAERDSKSVPFAIARSYGGSAPLGQGIVLLDRPTSNSAQEEPIAFLDSSLSVSDRKVRILRAKRDSPDPITSEVFAEVTVAEGQYYAVHSCRADGTSGSLELMVFLDESDKTVVIEDARINTIGSTFADQGVQHLRVAGGSDVALVLCAFFAAFKLRNDGKGLST